MGEIVLAIGVGDATELARDHMRSVWWL